MAIVLSIQKWRHYLLGHPFVIRTDQQSLKFLLEQREVGAEYQRWVSKLLGYQFTIVYKPGITDKAADALSRAFSETSELCTMISAGGVTWTVIQEAIAQDDFLLKLKADLEGGYPQPKGYELVQGVVRFKGRVVLPPKSEIVSKLLQEYHNSPVGGHIGEVKTYQRLATEWFWLGMRKEIAKYIRECSIYQQQKQSTLMPAGLL